MGLCVIPYEQIMAIDETGDSIAQFPHIYIDGSKIARTREFHVTGQVKGMNTIPHPENRISLFPNKFPEDPPLYAEA